jgi:hypothetical protein
MDDDEHHDNRTRDAESLPAPATVAYWMFRNCIGFDDTYKSLNAMADTCILRCSLSSNTAITVDIHSGVVPFRVS